MNNGSTGKHTVILHLKDSETEKHRSGKLSGSLAPASPDGANMEIRLIKIDEGMF